LVFNTVLRLKVPQSQFVISSYNALTRNLLLSLDAKSAQTFHDAPPQTQARFLEAVREHGRDPKLVSRSMGNRTIGACKKFYSKNRERLLLDAIAEQARARRRAKEAGAAAAVATAGPPTAEHVTGTEHVMSTK